MTSYNNNHDSWSRVIHHSEAIRVYIIAIEAIRIETEKILDHIMDT